MVVFECRAPIKKPPLGGLGLIIFNWVAYLRMRMVLKFFAVGEASAFTMFLGSPLQRGRRHRSFAGSTIDSSFSQVALGGIKPAHGVILE